MMSLLKFTILVVFGVVTSQNDDVNLQMNIEVTQENVEATTLIPPDPSIQSEEIGFLLARLEALCVERLEYLVTETNKRFQSLESQLYRCSMPNNNYYLETKVDNLSRNIQKLMDGTKNLTSDVEVVKQNVSSLINVTSTRSLEELSSNLELKQIFKEGLQEIRDLQTEATSCAIKYPRNCREAQEVRKFEKTSSENYMIQPKHAPKPFEVVCDLETRGGGWTVIQKRFDGSQDFYLGWENYKEGFGNFGGEFWLGLENIHLLTDFEVNELLVEMGDFESRNKSALYSEFKVGSEIEGYPLKVLGAYSGDAGDSLIYHAGRNFTTKDNNQDVNASLNCAQFSSGAWWYNGCAESNLNGKYLDRDQVYENGHHKIFWYHFTNNYNKLQHTRMLVRPKL